MRHGYGTPVTVYDLGAKEMMVEMHAIARVEQFCEGCVIGKQHRTPFRAPRCTVRGADWSWFTTISAGRSHWQLWAVTSIFC
jgi:hypothetical protein